MRVGQIWQWIYQWGMRDFAEMTNLSKALRAESGRTFRDRGARGRDQAGVSRTAPASIWCGSLAATRSRSSISPKRTAARLCVALRSAAR